MKTVHNPMYYDFAATRVEVDTDEILPSSIAGNCTVNGVPCRFDFTLLRNGSVGSGDLEPSGRGWNYDFDTSEYRHDDGTVVPWEDCDDAAKALENWIDERIATTLEAARNAAASARLAFFFPKEA